MLPKMLGKAFYKGGGGARRPIPVQLSDYRKKTERDSLGQKRSRRAEEAEKANEALSVGSAAQVAREIESAVGSALVHLSESATTAIKVAHTGMEGSEVAENTIAVSEGMVDKYVPEKWQNVRAIHLKGPNTLALPVWQTEELWLNEGKVLDEKWKSKEEDNRKKETLNQNKRKGAAHKIEEDSAVKRPAKKRKA